MDRRTLVFVVSLSLTLLLVNMFFGYLNKESKKQQYEQAKTIKIEKRNKLEEEIQKQTADLDQFPIAKIFADESQHEFLTSGILIDQCLLTLSWEDKPPDKVYVNGKLFELTYQAASQGSPVLYSEGKDCKLQAADLPLFGNYQLQLITFYPNVPNKSPLVTLGEYNEGQFSIPLKQLANLDKQLGQVEKEYEMPGNAIVLLKWEKRFLPVGIYESTTNSFLLLEQYKDLPTKILSKAQRPAADQPTKEQHYVLENAFQQLVFSNRGAALTEINLPFKSETHTKSVVKEIQFDRDILEDHPANAYFPLTAYLTPGENPEGPYIEHNQGKRGGYYPLIRRNLLRPKAQDRSIQIPAEFYSLNLVSEFPETAELMYNVTYFDQNKIVFEATQRNRKITKTYSLKTHEKIAPYCVDLTLKIEGDSKGLWLTSGVPEVEIISNSPAPALKYRITRKGKSEVNKIELPKKTETMSHIFPDWVCNSNGFLGLILDPLSEIGSGYRTQYVSGSVVPTRLVLIDAKYEKFKAKDLPGYMLMLPLNPKGGVQEFRIFAGPFASNILKTVDQIFSNPETGYNPDYIASQSFHGWFSFISQPFSKFLLILMNFFHGLTRSWGLSIILLTVALRVMLYPLNAWSTKSMLKMQQIAPEVQRIQEKYKKEPQKAQLHVMNLYRESGVNPLSGCFPLLIQMPFLIGMFDLLKSTFELRGATFIPGWIDNLAAPDVLFSWSKPIFFFGTEFHLLPFLLGAVMFLQQRFATPQSKDPSQMTEQQRQQRAMGSMMTVVFTVMFYHFPSGLNIYWLSSMLLGILQQWWTQKRFQKSPVVQLQPQVGKIEKRKKKR